MSDVEVDYLASLLHPALDKVRAAARSDYFGFPKNGDCKIDEAAEELANAIRECFAEVAQARLNSLEPKN